MSACTVFETTEVKPAYRVQLTPSDIPCNADLLIQGWLYNSLFVRVRSATLARDDLECILQQRESAVRGALYCAIPDQFFQPAFASMLRSRGYVFWNHEPTTNELIYYKWCGPPPDMVPHYGTSIEGGGLIVLSPDETKVLLVFELGRWCFPGGAVEYNETCQEAALREANEETGVQIDPTFPIRLVGGWNLAAARDQRINDHFLIFVSKATSETLQLDQHEISQAKWQSISELQPLLASLKEDDNSFSITYQNQSYSTSFLFALRRYLNGTSLDGAVHEIHVSDTYTRRIMYIR